MIRVFIDTHGLPWNGDSQAFADEFSIKGNLSGQTRQFLIRQAGICAATVQERFVTLEFVPALTSLDACLSIMKVLEKYRPERVGLSWYDKTWNYEITRGWKAAQKRVSALTVTNRSEPEARYLSTTQDLAELPRDNPLAQVFAHWRERSGEFKPSSDEARLSDSTNGRYFVVNRAGNASGLKFSHAGPGWHAFGDGWGARMVGRDVAHQPDLNYGKWCAQCFRHAIEIEQPQITFNDVLVRVPRNSTQKRIRYQRLTLPITAPSGTRRLLSATLLDNRIDLRSEI
ncbi:MAG: hypothetical protein ACR2PI_19040 [Hyphomicrobiaceae bacterium]